MVQDICNNHNVIKNICYFINSITDTGLLACSDADRKASFQLEAGNKKTKAAGFTDLMNSFWDTVRII